MQCKVRYIILSVFIVICISWAMLDTAFADEIHNIKTVNLGNSGEAQQICHWLEVRNYREIRNWGRGIGLLAIPDSAPIVDSRAGFVSRFGSSVRITDLKRNLKYRMWLDFVIFRSSGKENITSRLEILVDGRRVCSLNFGDINRYNNPYMLELPYDLTIDGSVEIIFKEYSYSGGFWGIWDIIVSDSYQLPDKNSLPPEKKDISLDIKEKIIEKKGTMDKIKPEKNKGKGDEGRSDKNGKEKDNSPKKSKPSEKDMKTDKNLD